MSFSCSCCQSVTILNGLNVDVALSSDTISTRTVANYRAFQFCVYVPGCLFSTACVNILELNQFPKSITACLRLDIYAKKQLWQINYDCVSVSTELPSMSMTGTTRMMDMTSEEVSTAGTEQTRQSPMTELVMEMASTETMTMQTPEMNSALTIAMMEQVNRTNAPIVE
ncbi:hypothetical protein X777_11470 [Ooceraea biroi]|uniref:DUF4773 domain-containing protein n=1 Tax=Ooceraea biroi TaxID=2015173 RepID=A0A026W1P2_OOCBI|nr:hypothetical protein X777_11470 [Ooceraea biroi]